MRPAEQLSTCLDLSAAEVPCKTAPFASFSGRAEKEGPARPERVPMSSSVVKAIKKASVTQKFYEMVLVRFDETISFFDRLSSNDCFCFLLFYGRSYYSEVRI